MLLIGHLGRDAEVKYTQYGTAIAQFRIATTERWRSKNDELQQHTGWFAAKAFGCRAEVVGEHLRKGSRVYLEGCKRAESWDDKRTGAKVTGQRAFSGETAAVVKDAIQNEDPTPLGHVNPALPEKLESIVIRAIEKDRERRY